MHRTLRPRQVREGRYREDRPTAPSRLPYATPLYSTPTKHHHHHHHHHHCTARCGRGRRSEDRRSAPHGSGSPSARGSRRSGRASWPGTEATRKHSALTRRSTAHGPKRLRASSGALSTWRSRRTLGSMGRTPASLGSPFCHRTARGEGASLQPSPKPGVLPLDRARQRLAPRRRNRARRGSRPARGARQGDSQLP